VVVQGIEAVVLVLVDTGLLPDLPFQRGLDIRLPSVLAVLVEYLIARAEATLFLAP
jgi:hypothetical protein